MNMQTMNRKADLYRKNQIATASEGQLIIMLYDGAIRFLRKAKTSMIEKDVEQSHEAITRARKIVLELMFSLDMEKGEDISRNLYELYFFLNQELIKANIKKDTVILDDCLEIITNLRTTWKQVIEKSKKTTETDS